MTFLGTETLDQYLIRTGIPEKVFGRRIKKTQSAINRIRRGMRQPSLETALAIQDATDGAVPPESFKIKCRKKGAR